MMLREQLASAYESPAWDRSLIDRLAAEIAETERALASGQRHAQENRTTVRLTLDTTGPGS